MRNTLMRDVMPQSDSENIEATLRPWFVDATNPDMAERDYQLTAQATSAIDKGG